MSLLEKEYYKLQNIVDEINSYSKNEKVTIQDILEQGAQGKITINADMVYYQEPLHRISKEERYPLSPDSCRTLLLDKQLSFQGNFLESSCKITIEQLYVLSEEKERFMQDVKQKVKNLDPDGYDNKNTFTFSNENHPNFAPDLKIAVEAWQGIFGEDASDDNKQKGVEALLKSWLKNRPEYLDLTKSRRKRIATIITPKHRKDGGAIKTPDK